MFRLREHPPAIATAPTAAYLGLCQSHVSLEHGKIRVKKGTCPVFVNN
jgi:hypothetical protein